MAKAKRFAPAQRPAASWAGRRRGGSLPFSFGDCYMETSMPTTRSLEFLWFPAADILLFLVCLLLLWHEAANGEGLSQSSVRLPLVVGGGFCLRWYRRTERPR